MSKSKLIWSFEDIQDARYLGSNLRLFLEEFFGELKVDRRLDFGNAKARELIGDLLLLAKLDSVLDLGPESVLDLVPDSVLDLVPESVLDLVPDSVLRTGM